MIFSPTSRHRISLGFLIALFSLTFIPGCALRGTLSAWKKNRPQENFKVQYALQDAQREIDPWSSFSEDGLQTANWMPRSFVNHNSSKPAALTIEYPNPQGDAETALATLKIYSEPLDKETYQPAPEQRWYSRVWPVRRKSDASSTQLPIPEEVVTLELPREKFESVMNELNRNQYLDENDRHPQQTELASLMIERNQRTIHSSGEVAPLLNEMIRHIYENGHWIVGDRGRSTPSVLQTSGIEAPFPRAVQ
ncbi:MAG: hypothetical protein HUJ26_14465 [Planctomycetaceae bacterium]|nr:hypothetical protein [Planctomycetaceae bacterium]